MTTREIAEAVGKDASTVSRWVSETSCKMQQISCKMQQARETSMPADYDIEETCAIIETGMGKNAADLFRMSASAKIAEISVSLTDKMSATTDKMSATTEKTSATTTDAEYKCRTIESLERMVSHCTSSGFTPAQIVAICGGSASSARTARLAIPKLPPVEPVTDLMSRPEFTGWREVLQDKPCAFEFVGVKLVTFRGGTTVLAVQHNHRILTRMLGKGYSARLRADSAYLDTRQLHVLKEQISCLTFKWADLVTRNGSGVKLLK